MKQILKHCRALWRDESGAAAVEYGLLAGLISVVIVTGVTALGGKLESVFTTIANAIKV